MPNNRRRRTGVRSQSNIGIRPQPAREAASPAKNGPGRIIVAIGSIIAPATLIAALLFYFGWIRTNSLFQHFGIEAPVLGFGNQDYILRSVDGLYLPLGGLLALGIIGSRAHAWLVHFLGVERRRKYRRGLFFSLLALAAVSVILGIASLQRLIFPYDTFAAPLQLSLGVAAGAYVSLLARKTRSESATRPGLSGLEAMFWVTLLTLLTFWTVTEYAAAVGRGRAIEFSEGLGSRPGVIVFSASRLFLEGDGVKEIALPLAAGDDSFKFRYEGLRLLAYSNDRFFLLPAGWRPDPSGQPAMILDQGDKVRIEFVPGSGA